ncbi:MAG: sigma-54-dependent Fis family transcriptional regulator [Bacteroidetes bacterium]|nr:sigma-54-dependent Fis family transcriptional regulator [Bacteroidota bacterium]
MDIQSIKARFGIIGNAPALNHALHVAGQVAATDLSVLIVGESGVGKEAFSNIIHSLSTRKHNPFIAVNCGAIPEGTIDSELFGHEKGSFTGAVDHRKGYFETVNGGTIFLDEIGELPLGTQARLLRVLETGEFIRVGSSKVQKTNVRVIAATNKELLELAAHHKFREDLYYRLSTVPIRVPALRERQEDIGLLFRKFAGDFAERYRSQSVQLDSGAQQLLLNYPWPGNVRELKNIAEQVSVLATDKLITADVLADVLPRRLPTTTASLLPTLSHAPNTHGADAGSTERDILYKLFFELKKDMNDVKSLLFEMTHGSFQAGAQHGSGSENLLPSVSFPENTGNNFGGVAPVVMQSVRPMTQHEEVEESLSLTDREKELIIKALKKHRGRRRDAASELGISERTLYRKIKEYDIDE